MKMSRAWFLTLMVAALVGWLAAPGLAASPATVPAASHWYVCQVDATGPITAGTGARIFLTDTAGSPAFTNQEFQAPRGRANEFLAVALEAISLNKKVKICTGPETGALPYISAIYLQAQ